MLKTKDILTFLLSGIGVIAVGFLVSAIDSLPMWFLLILSIILWVTLIVMVARERIKEKKEPKLMIMHRGKWVPVTEKHVRDILLENRKVTQQLFDQDEDAIKHLDFENVKDNK